MNAIFILSALNRSGTNYLSDIIQLDIRFSGVPGIPEDYLLAYSSSLFDYTLNTVKHWSHDHEEDRIAAQKNLMNCLGTALGNQLTRRVQNAESLVLKTPRPYGIRHIPSLFPGQKLIVIDRDGRDVVESFLKSFSGYTFMQVTRLWRDGIREINEFLACSHINQGVESIRVRYEDLVNADERALEQISLFCGLDPAAVNQKTVLSLPLRGSSVIRGSEERLHWNPVPRPSGYDPRAKWLKWPVYKRFLFDRVAGKELRALGYTG